MTDTNPRDLIFSTMQILGLSIEATFVPWSKSRFFVEDAPIGDRSLNWKITLVRSGAVRRENVLTTDYFAGIAHCPSYRSSARATLDYVGAITMETEHGKRSNGGKSILPDEASVMASLLTDADVIDHASFESWASDLGYDTDSRKAEATYRACLAIGLALRNAVGDAGLADLRNAARDF